MTKIYKNQQNDTIRADAAPDESWVEISHGEYMAICESRRVVPEPATDIEDKKRAVRAARKQILDILTGITLAAQLVGDTATTGAYLVVLQGLKDITEDWPTDPALVEGVVMQRYAALKAQCTPQMVSAFAQVAA